MPSVSNGKEATNSQTPKPIAVCLLGSPASGKTCFLAGLAVLAEPDRHSKVEVHARGQNKERLDQLANILRRQQWPPGTHTEAVIETKVLLNGQSVDVAVMDYPGGDFQEDLRKLNEKEGSDLYQHLTQANTLLLLFDPDLDVRKPSEAGAKVKTQQIERLEAFLQVIREHSERRNLDIGIVLSKSDIHPQLRTSRQIKAFMHAHLPNLMKRLKKYSASMAYFAVSAVGSTEETEVAGDRCPARELKPYGYEEIFDWVIDREQKRRNVHGNRILWGLVSLAVVAALVAGGLWFAQLESYRRILESPNSSPIEKIERTPTGLPGELGRRREEILNTRLGQFEGAIQSAKTETDLDPVDEELRKFLVADLGYHRERVEKLLYASDRRREHVAFQRAKDQRKSPVFSQLAQEFLSKWPTGEYAEQVRVWLGEDRSAQQQAKRASIRREVITNAVTLKQKLRMMQEYLSEWGDVDERESVRIRRAVELGTDILNKKEYQVVLKSSGEFKEPASHWIRITIGQAPEQAFHRSTASTIVNWNEPLAAKWKFGDAVTLNLNADYRLSNPIIAVASNNGPLSIQLFGPMTDLRITADGEKLVSSAYFKFEVPEVSKEDFEIISDYLHPGGKW